MGWTNGAWTRMGDGGKRGITGTSSMRRILGVHVCACVCVMTKLPSLFVALDRSVLIRCEYNSSIGR